MVFINISDDQKLQARSKTLVREGCTKKAWSFTKLPSDPHPFPLGLFFFFGKAKYCHVFGHYAISCYFWPFIRPKKGVGFILGDSPLWFGEGPQFPPLFCPPILHPLTPGSGTAILSLHPLTDCFHVSYPINGFPHQVQSSLINSKRIKMGQVKMLIVLTK